MNHGGAPDEERSVPPESDLSSGRHPVATLDRGLSAQLLEWVARPPLVVKVPPELRPRFDARKQEDIRRVLGIGGLCGILLAVVIVAARMAFYRDVGTPADESLYARISAFNVTVIVATVLLLHIPRAFRHYQTVMATGGALVLASTHAGSLLIREPHIATSATYACMLGATVVTIGFRNGTLYSLSTCAAALLGGSLYAAAQGAEPDWVFASYGFVGATAVGAVIAWLVERQDALHFFQSILLVNEAEERRRLNEQLAAMSRTDSLSGLANRRSFDDTLELEWARMRRERTPLSLLFVDIDHFKRFNDAHGHRDGDACLQSVGQAIARAALRPADLAARYGGEEFVVLLPNTTLAGAEEVAQRTVALVDALAIPHGDSPTATHVTISVGVAAADPSSELEARHLVETADACLYRAKKQGRHGVVASLLRGDSIRPMPRNRASGELR